MIWGRGLQQTNSRLLSKTKPWPTHTLSVLGKLNNVANRSKSQTVSIVSKNKWICMTLISLMGDHIKLQMYMKIINRRVALVRITRPGLSKYYSICSFPRCFCMQPQLLKWDSKSQSSDAMQGLLQGETTGEAQTRQCSLQVSPSNSELQRRDPLRVL